MALKKVTKNNDDIEKRKYELRATISRLDIEISTLRREKAFKEIELLELEIKPFKIGGYALVEVPSGKTKKWQKCLLELEHAVLYARPVKENGELSARHFSVVPVTKPYSEALKEVK